MTHITPRLPLPHFSPPPPTLTSLSHLRLGTFNVGRGLARKLPHIIQRCLSLSLDIIALQEIGDPALLSTKFPQYFLTYTPGPSLQEAGVALLISNDLAPRCRSFKRSKSGRLVGVVMELEQGQSTLIICSYMPSGLDHQHLSSDTTQHAHTLYNEMMQWALHTPHVIIMGDLNQTMTPHDRLPHPLTHHHTSAAAASSPIQCLQQEHFIDAYRLLHPYSAAAASSHPSRSAFTHEIISERRNIRSRIDYIWTRGYDRLSHININIDTKLHAYSHHHLLWITMEIKQRSEAHCRLPPLFSQHLPNLRTATEQHKTNFVNQLEKKMARHQPELQQLLDDASPSSTLSSLASRLTSLTHRAALSSLPITGSSPYRSKSVLQFQRQQRALTSLLHIAVALRQHHISFAHSPEWVKRYQQCITHHGVNWSVDAFYHQDDAAWIAETKRHIASTRKTIRKVIKHMMKHKTPAFDANPAAMIHRMLKSDSLPSHLYSVVTKEGHLTATASELEDAMVDYFTSVFAIPPHDPHPLPRPPPDILFHKPNIKQEWYQNLMDDVSEAELLTSIRHTNLISAPGEDQVSTGVWKTAIMGSETTCSLVAQLFTQCIRTSTFPSAWKTSVIVPLIKDASKERVMTNVRPISLQSCLGKLLNNILAQRLGAILSKHPILNPAQRGFIIGGATLKCVDELLDAWDWSRKQNKELYTLFYDIKQAYDSVQTQVLTRALRRIHLPPSFVGLIEDSLTGLSSCVRTAYGLSRPFSVQRSIRQGDPLSSLLFVILLDPLHDGLELNPFTQQRHGCVIKGAGWQIELPSLGYADDTAALTNSLADLQVQNEWVQYFMQFNVMRLNALKCELVGRDATGQPVTQLALTTNHINIDGHSICPTPHDQAIRYLGVHSSFNGSWSVQQAKARDMIMIFTRLVSKFSLSIGQAIYMFNVFLLPKLELALHYVHGAGTSKWVKDLDRLLIGCIKHISHSPLQLSHSALALTLHLTLPSWLEAAIKVSELFIRMNSNDDRWAPLGRHLMRQDCTSKVDSNTPLPRADSGSGLTRAAYLALHKLRWTLHLTDQPRAGSRHRHLFKVEPLDALPPLTHCSSTPLIHFNTHQSHTAHDIWTGWGRLLPSADVVVYTDGSYSSASSTSAWSLVVSDQWLNCNFASIPSDEQLILPAHVGGATTVGASIKCTRGVYPAELQAIARSIAMFPLTFNLDLHTDSLASLKAIDSYERQLNPRQRLRMSARPLLQLVSHLISSRNAAGGSVTLSHVRAHTTDSDVNSVGNRLADYQANLARSKPDRSWPLGLSELPLSACEHHLTIRQHDDTQMIDDVRRTALIQLRSHAMMKWSGRDESQGCFAHQGILNLGRTALKHGDMAEQTTLVHVATNSIHYHWVEQDDGTSALQQIQCSSCQQTMTLTHLISCTDSESVRVRQQLQNDIIDIIDNSNHTSDWLRNHRHLTPHQFARQLFPPPSSATTTGEQQLHLTRIMIGAFTSAEANAALKLLGVVNTPRQKDPTPLQRISLLTLQHINNIYNKWKESD